MQGKLSCWHNILISASNQCTNFQFHAPIHLLPLLCVCFIFTVLHAQTHEIVDTSVYMLFYSYPSSQIPCKPIWPVKLMQITLSFCLFNSPGSEEAFHRGHQGEHWRRPCHGSKANHIFKTGWITIQFSPQYSQFSALFRPPHLFEHCSAFGEG